MEIVRQRRLLCKRPDELHQRLVNHEPDG